MKVLHIIGSLSKGGTETLVYDLVKNASKYNINLFLLARSYGNMTKTFASSGINFEVKIAKNKFKYIKNLRNFIRINNINIIHVHQSIDVYYVFLATAGLNKGLIFTVHGFNNKFRSLMQLTLAVKLADRVVTVSKSFLKRIPDYLFLNKKKFSVIYNGIDFDKFYLKKGSLKDELNIPQNKLLLGTIGNFFNDVRDQFTICKSLDILINKIKLDFYFVFIGTFSKSNPIYFNKCYKFCEERNLLKKVFFMGSRNDIDNVLSSLDCFVYASNRDTFGIAVVEALGKGLPVIVNDLDVFLEITKKGLYASLYPTKNYYELARLIENIVLEYYSKSKLLINMNTKSYIYNNFSIEVHIKNLIQLYENLSKNLN